MKPVETADNRQEKTITVAGVTFSAQHVVTATVKIDGREVSIGKKDDRRSPCGFGADTATENE